MTLKKETPVINHLMTRFLFLVAIAKTVVKRPAQSAARSKKPQFVPPTKQTSPAIARDINVSATKLVLNQPKQAVLSENRAEKVLPQAKTDPPVRQSVPLPKPQPQQGIYPSFCNYEITCSLFTYIGYAFLGYLNVHW